MIRWWNVLKPKLLLVYFIAIVAGLASCRTARDLPATRLKPLSAEKLLDIARENAFEFEDLSIRRINVQFSNDDNRTSFRATIRATRNDKMLATVSKLNIPVARVLLTPENVTFVNFIDKNYFAGDYSYLSAMLNFDINFDLVQAVLSNPVKTYLSESFMDEHNLESAIEEGRYVLQPAGRINRFVFGQRLFKGRNSNSSSSANFGELEINKLVFNPHSFVLEKMVMEASRDDRKLEVDFNDFEKVDNYDYPGSIGIKMFNGDELTELSIRLRGFSTEKVEDLQLNVPDSYQRIRAR